ncbi:phosphatase PAP2 family protein [Prauserella oleivorans]|uniref:Phosphatase PAP2 family protein n=1 Tax=Prauserella oleivorans TaxID=1478153 RepID=A0ABW5W8F7_9PSEU
MRPGVIVGVLSLVAFAALGVVVRDDPSGLDTWLGTALHGDWRGPAGGVAEVVSAILGPVIPVLFALGLVVAAVAAWRRGDRQRATLMLRVLVLLGLCRATSWLAKPLFERERPRVYPDFAYPSGHVVSVASAGFAAVVLCAWLAPHLVRTMTWIVAAATVVCAASRVVLDVHWLTDTVGAVLAVTGVGLLAGAALRLLPAQRPGVASST